MTGTTTDVYAGRGGKLGRLAMWLRAVQANDLKYTVRGSLVLHALAEALACGLEAGIRFDPEEPDWPVVFIELPSGQVSWHLAQHPKPWDGHTTPEKFARIEAFCQLLEEDDEQ